MMHQIIADLLTRANAEFAKINADLAATSRNLKARARTADAITGAMSQAARHSLTPETGKE